jgi:hypothetical protein
VYQSDSFVCIQFDDFDLPDAGVRCDCGARAREWISPMNLDFDTLDDAAQISNAYDATVQVFINTPSDSGSFWHVTFGLATSFLPDLYPLVASLMFAGYEVSKLASGESAQRVAGSLMEWGFGMAAGTLAYRSGWVKR